jgi:hypothetical protein
MFADTSRQAPHLPAPARQAGGRLRRLAAALAAVTCGLLASSRPPSRTPTPEATAGSPASPRRPPSASSRQAEWQAGRSP